MYIRCCVLFPEHGLSFHGHCSKISDPDSGLFLSALGLHNRVLALHLHKSTGSSSFIFITKCP